MDHRDRGYGEEHGTRPNMRKDQSPPGRRDLIRPTPTEFEFNYATALRDGVAASADACVQQIRRQPLSSNEHNNLSNNPTVSVCTYTSHGNVAFVRALGPSEGDGVQVTATVWQVQQ